jgi:sugar lactone lactonase YvrE
MTDSAQSPKVPEVRTLLTGLGFGESPRWHEGRLWFSNWGMQEVVAVGLDGKSEIIVRVATTAYRRSTRTRCRVAVR